MPKPHILLTNDDGINAWGIKRLWTAAHEIGSTTIVAPAQNKTGASTSVTIYDLLPFAQSPWEQDIPAYSVDGTPADCVKVALGKVLDSHPDLLLSGINHGSNAGRNVLYSGTIGSVIEGVLRGIPGIAFSICDFDPNNRFSHLTPYINQIITYVLKHPLPPGTFLNVNFPNTPIRGIKMARQGKEYWTETVHHNCPKTLKLIGKKNPYDDEHIDSDIALLKEGYATAVPIHISELTDHTHYTDYKDHFESSLN